MTDKLYYARGRNVYKAPVCKKVEGGTDVSLGFHACTATEIVGEDGAEAIAALLTLGEQAQAGFTNAAPSSPDPTRGTATGSCENAQVKPLEWSFCGQSASRPVIHASAFGIDRFYSVKGLPGEWTLSYPGSDSMTHVDGFSTQNAARVAAQADYEARAMAAVWAAPPTTHVAPEAQARDAGISFGIAMSVAFLIRDRDEPTIAREWWNAAGLTIEQCERIGVDEYDLEPIRAALAATEGSK